MTKNDQPPKTANRKPDVNPALSGSAGAIQQDWQRRGRAADRQKTTLTLRLDGALVEAIRSSGPGYGSRVERVLREAVSKGQL